MNNNNNNNNNNINNNNNNGLLTLTISSCMPIPNLLTYLINSIQQRLMIINYAKSMHLLHMCTNKNNRIEMFQKKIY